MAAFELKKYLRGKRNFWLYVLLTFLSSVPANFFLGETRSPTWGEIIMLCLLYFGFVWVWYFVTVLIVVGDIAILFLAITYIPELNWMVHVYQPIQFVMGGFLGASMAALTIILIVKKDLKYFVKIKQLKRKGMLDAHILKELKTSIKGVE